MKKFMKSRNFARFIAITCTIIVLIGIYGLLRTPVPPEKEFGKMLEMAQGVFALMFLIFIAVKVEKDKKLWSNTETKDI